MIQVQCQQCGKTIQVEDRYAGQSGTCKGCGASIQVPAVTPVVEPSTSFDDLWDEQAEAMTQQKLLEAGETAPSEEKLEGRVPLQAIDVTDVPAQVPKFARPTPPDPEPVATNEVTDMPEVPAHILRRHENLLKRQKRQRVMGIVFLVVLVVALGFAWFKFSSTLKSKPAPARPTDGIGLKQQPPG